MNNDTSTYPLRLPKSLKAQVTQLAKRDGTSMNQFIAIAVAEKVSALEVEHFFTGRAAGADLLAFEKLVTRSGGIPPQEDDQIN